MKEHSSERQFAPYSTHIFQPAETFIARNHARLSHYPPGSYVPLTDEQILDVVLKTLSENNQSTDDTAEGAGSPVIRTSSTSMGDIPERDSSPVTPCDSTVDDETLWHFQNDGEDDHTGSRTETYPSGRHVTIIAESSNSNYFT